LWQTFIWVNHTAYNLLCLLNLRPRDTAQRELGAGVRPSMGSVGDAYDNAMCESFFATLECELLARSRFKTQAEARHAIFEFVEGFYNRRRRHSSIGYLSPVDYEQRHPATRSTPTHTSLPSGSQP
jgi:putative transposase